MCMHEPFLPMVSHYSTDQQVMVKHEDVHQCATNSRVDGSVPSSFCVHVEVCSSETLSHKLLQMVRLAPCTVARCHQYVCVWMRGKA